MKKKWKKKKRKANECVLLALISVVLFQNKIGHQVLKWSAAKEGKRGKKEEAALSSNCLGHSSTPMPEDIKKSISLLWSVHHQVTLILTSTIQFLFIPTLIWLPLFLKNTIRNKNIGIQMKLFYSSINIH